MVWVCESNRILRPLRIAVIAMMTAIEPPSILLRRRRWGSSWRGHGAPLPSFEHLRKAAITFAFRRAKFQGTAPTPPVILFDPAATTVLTRRR